MAKPIHNGLAVEHKTLTPAFSDARGDIFDLLEEKVGHVGMITFTKGAVRANHYHRESTQYSYVLEGKIRLTTYAVDGSQKEETILVPGSFSRIPPLYVHRYEALEDSKILDMTTLSRTDDGYEQDTVRITNV
ncbi:cupin domain-containing protein [Patescibacteria group bacterium]|nr:cupin domain-containing protein [Patescibacteria group bacterium]